MKEKELYKVSIDYKDEWGNAANETAYMRLNEGEKKIIVLA